MTGKGFTQAAKDEVFYCAVDGCDKRAARKGWCVPHYTKWRRHGDPTVSLRRSPIKDPEERFARLTRRGAPSERRPDLGPCLIYIGKLNPPGYAPFEWPGRKSYAHRYAWEREHGPIPDGMTVDHLCFVRSCVEVTHLDLCDLPTNFRRAVESWTDCKNGHPYVDGSYQVKNGQRHCLICRRANTLKSQERRIVVRRQPPPANVRHRYDQALVAAQVARIRAGETTIMAAAQVIGCTAQYLGRRAWDEVRADVMERDGNSCARCGHRALDVHHRITRGAGGRGGSPLIAYGMANLLALCRPCHDWVTDNPLSSRRLGLSLESWQDPSTSPLRRLDGTWWQPGETWTPAEPPVDAPVEVTP